MRECKNCGKCCANILLVSSDEVKLIKKHIKENNVKPINRQSVMIPYQDICPFLGHDNKCKVYEVRPAICKRYQCYDEPTYDLNYKKLKAINMLKTFYPNEYCADIDLTNINRQLEKNKKIIYGKEAK